MAVGRGLFSSSAAVKAATGAERRRSVRHITVLQVAKLRTSASEELCLLRDVSEEGLKAEIYSPVVQDELVTVELRTGHSIVGRVAWVEKALMGVQFTSPVPIIAMLAHCAFDERLSRLRPPRIDIDLPAVLTTWDEVLDVRVINISQAGLRIAVGKPLTADAKCGIVIPSLPRREATIRWSHKGECGLQLTQPLSYREFATWRSLLFVAVSAAGGALPAVQA